MRRLLIAVLAVLFIASPVAAQRGKGSPHLVPGQANPTFTDLGNVLLAEGRLAGLATGVGATIELIATGTMTTQCRNPAGNVAPGHTLEGVILSGEQFVDPQAISRAGTFTFAVRTDEPTVTREAAGCPNPQWRGEVADVEFTFAQIYVIQEGVRTLVFSGPVT